MNFDVPSTWLKEQYPAVDTSAIKTCDFPDPLLAKIVLFDEGGAETSNLATVFDGLVQGMKNEGVEKKRVTHAFDPPVFFNTNSALVPRIKTTAVSVSVEIERSHVLRRTKMSNFTQLILHN